MYYVYTLAYPDGTVFYVGKGTGNRVHQHESQAKHAKWWSTNPRKIEIIREILKSGQQVVKTKVAEFESEQDAYILEWGIMCMHCRADQFTNISRSMGRAKVKRPLEAPHKEVRRTIEKWRSAWHLSLFHYREEVPPVRGIIHYRLPVNS